MNDLPPVGKHCLVELHGCDPALLDDLDHVRRTLADAAQHGMSTLLNVTCHRFEPQGVTALALLAESHLSIHTWPEHGYAAVDAFTCGTTADPVRCCRYIGEALGATRVEVRTIARGVDLPASADASVDPSTPAVA
ncbi:MAG: adenosylmethionine decarboxylase [Planctomycetota bacterium]